MRSTPEHNRRKRNALIIAAIAVIALVAWIGAALALGTGSGGEEGGSGGEQAQAPETTAGEQTAPETTERDDGPQQEGEEQQAVSEGEDAGPPPTHPNVPSQPSPPGDWQQGEAPEGGEPPVANNPDSGSSSSGSSSRGSDESADSSGDSGDGVNSGEDGSGEGEEYGFDPLGKNPKPGDLTETQTQRVKDTADRFITAVYGYTGNSREDYEQGIEQAALTHGLYRSPGGERIQQYAKAAGEGGITSAAVMDRFEITGTSTGRVEGVAYFEVGKTYNRYAELKGDTTAFEQKLTLAPMQGSYRVIGAEAEQQQGGN